MPFKRGRRSCTGKKCIYIVPFVCYTQLFSIAHHANTFGVKHTLLIACEKIGTITISMIEYDTNFMNQFDISVKELYDSALKWAYEDTVIIPTDMITSGIEKCRISLHLNLCIKTFYLWKNMTKIENLPLPPSKRILPVHHSYWNCTKHGSDRKTQYSQSLSTLIPNSNLEAKLLIGC